MKNQFLLSCLLCFHTIVLAQEPHFLLHDLGDENVGISIRTLLQDHNSMIWLGTERGLARYDGLRWHPVRLDTSATPHHITSLMEDRAGKIWIGTLSGKIFFLDESRKVFPMLIEEGNPAKPVTSIVQDQSGQIWFATYGEGAYVYTGERLFNFNDDDGLSGNDIYTMVSTPEGNIWMGTDNGISICAFRNEKKSIAHVGIDAGLPDQIITTLQSDIYGRIWIGTFENGVVYYDPSNKKIMRPFLNDEIGEVTAIEIFDGTEVWIGTGNSGLWRFHPDSGREQKLVGFNTSYEGEIQDLMIDVEGNIWVAMNDGQLISAFRPIETLEVHAGDIQTVFCDRHDQLWLGSKKGLYKVIDEKNAASGIERVLPHHELNITDILEDNFGNLWIGTLDNGLFLYQLSSKKLKQISPSVLGGNTVMSMAISSTTIWISTLQGVISFPATKNAFLEKQIRFDLVNDPWQSNLHFVFQVFTDSKDRAWFATDGNGVFCINGNEVKQFQGDDQITIQTVYSVCEDKSGHLWFNTPDLGLIEFDGTHYNPLGISEGLGNITTAALAMTGKGDIVIAHRRGIDLLEPERRHFMYYGSEAGVKDIDPALNSITTDSKGHVYLSGKNKIIKFYSPKNELSIHPQTQLTRVAVYERPVDFTVENQFGYNENYISFDYIGLWYTSPESVNYLYKLDGYDLHWKESRDNTASYSSLPPGNYTFYVKASENKFFLDEPLASYSFEIAKPFWNQYWFVGSVIILGGALLFLIIKSREKRSKRQAIMQKEMIESQLQALKAQINPHFLFNSFNTLITIIDENAGKPAIAVEYVEKLSDFFRSILQYREQETISLEEELELVQNYGYLLEKRYGSNLRLHLDKAPKDSYILPLTLQMLVENAVKHNVIADHKPLDVFITVEDEYVTVRNNVQPKSKVEPSTQFGLQSIIRRYGLMTERKIIVEKLNGYFQVRIPVLKQVIA